MLNEPVFDSLHLDVAAEDGIDNLVQDVWVLDLRLDHDLLTLRAFSLVNNFIKTFFSLRLDK